MKTKYFKNRQEWRTWLADHFDKESEIWFVFPLKNSGKPALSYNDAVEEALCFGWIDSTVKKLDDYHKIQRFTPRNSKSSFSQANIERMRWLAQKDLLHPSVGDKVAPLLAKSFIYPDDILRMIREDEAAWNFFQQTSPAYQRIRLAYIDAARNRPEEFEKRLQHLIKKCKNAQLIPGYGGIDKYY